MNAIFHYRVSLFFPLTLALLLAACGGGGGTLEDDEGNEPGAPVAVAGEDMTVQSGDTVELHGWDSTDEDGAIVFFAWEQTAGTTVTLEDDGSGTATFIAPPSGESDLALTFRLTVEDDEGKTDTDSVTVTVEAQGSTPEGFGLLHDDAINPWYLTVVGDKAFFVADDVDDGPLTSPDSEQVWMTDGTFSGTRMVLELAVDDEADGHATILTAFKGGVVVNGWDGEHHDALWFTDGTEAGTYLIKDITTAVSETIRLVGVGGDYFYFTANDGVHGRELWASDGTPEGTHMIVDLNPAGDSNIERASEATYWNGNYYVFAWYYEAGTFTAYPQLYRTDGTPGNFVQLTNSTYPGSSLLDYEMMVFNDRLFFTWHSWENSQELWSTDGTPAGTQLFVNIAPEHSGYTYGSWPSAFHLLGDSLLFFAYEDGTGSHKSLYRTDGTEAGTELVYSVDLGVLVENMVMMNGRYYFPGRSHDENLLSLWSTDGTSAGTQQVSTVRPEQNFFDERAVAVGDRLVFAATDEARGWEPWVSDGTAGGTFMLKDVHPSGDGFASGGGRYTVRNGKAYFVAAFTDTDFQLFETDGTTAGTQVIAPDDATNTANTMGYQVFSDMYPLPPPTLLGNTLLLNGNFHGSYRLYRN